jgi:hypothetical protein
VVHLTFDHRPSTTGNVEITVKILGTLKLDHVLIQNAVFIDYRVTTFSHAAGKYGPQSPIANIARHCDGWPAAAYVQE